MSADPAVQAAAEALHHTSGDNETWPDGGCDGCYDDADIAITAARPVIEAEVRKQIESKIREAWHEQCSGYVSLANCESCRAYDIAADIARGQS